MHHVWKSWLILMQIGLPTENHRKASLSMWAETFDASKNHSAFSDFLFKLINHADAKIKI